MEEIKPTFDRLSIGDIFNDAVESSGEIPISNWEEERHKYKASGKEVRVLKSKISIDDMVQLYMQGRLKTSSKYEVSFSQGEVFVDSENPLVKRVYEKLNNERFSINKKQDVRVLEDHLDHIVEVARTIGFYIYLATPICWAHILLGEVTNKISNPLEDSVIYNNGKKKVKNFSQKYKNKDKFRNNGEFDIGLGRLLLDTALLPCRGIYLAGKEFYNMSGEFASYISKKFKEKNKKEKIFNTEEIYGRKEIIKERKKRKFIKPNEIIKKLKNGSIAVGNCSRMVGNGFIDFGYWGTNFVFRNMKRGINGTLGTYKDSFLFSLVGYGIRPGETFRGLDMDKLETIVKTANAGEAYIEYGRTVEDIDEIVAKALETRPYRINFSYQPNILSKTKEKITKKGKDIHRETISTDPANDHGYNADEKYNLNIEIETFTENPQKIKTTSEYSLFIKGEDKVLLTEISYHILDRIIHARTHTKLKVFDHSLTHGANYGRVYHSKEFFEL